jgi:hypothetical protein
VYISYGGDAAARDGAADVGEAGPPDDHFITGVVSFGPGPCAGFGQEAMPQIVYGPPVGQGLTAGSTDVVSLGVGGSIVVTFAPNAIVDGPGVDFVVFENPFYIAGNPNNVYAEPGIVSVSDDGVTWTSFPCTATQGNPPYGSCAGWHPVTSSPASGISPFDYPACGGDAFDLADIGVTHARYVKIVDHSGEVCPATNKPNTDGFDLDAIAILHGELP